MWMGVYDHVGSPDKLIKYATSLEAQVARLTLERDVARREVRALAESLDQFLDFIEDIRQDGSCEFFHEGIEPGETIYQHAVTVRRKS
jgi:hypothetical protein